MRTEIESLLDSLPGCIVVLDAGGRVSAMNAAADRWLGPSIGQPHLALALEGALQDRIRRCLEDRLPRNHSMELERPGSDTCWLDVSLIPRTDGGGLVITAVDSTEKRQLEAALVRSSQLASLGTMAGSLAHEINNPLTVVLGTLEVMIEDVQLGQPELAASLRRVERNSWQCVDIVRTFLKVSRPNATAGVLVRPDEVLSDLLTLLGKQLANAGVEVRLELEPGLPSVSANPTHLQQVLLNLILNARDAMPEGGRLTVRGRIEESNVVLEVEDTGVGIPEPLLDRIFEPFFTTKPAGLGTGLGLSICRSLIVEHQGDLWVSSKPGQGTTFFVRLEQDPAQRAASSASRVSRVEPDNLGLEILGIDDEPDILAVLRALVMRAGCRLTGFTSGAAALRELTPGRYDLALIDIRMPGMNGIEASRRVHAIDPGLPALFVTGELLADVSPPDPGPANLGVLHKPFSEKELRSWLTHVATVRSTTPPGEVAAPPSKAAAKHRVLAVDDDESLLVVIKHLLEMTGKFLVDVAETAEQALEMACRLPPDLILLDIMMPGVDGLEACRRLKTNAATRSIPIVMMSARSDLADVVRALSAGAVHYLIKPLDPLGMPKKLLEILSETNPDCPVSRDTAA